MIIGYTSNIMRNFRIKESQLLYSNGDSLISWDTNLISQENNTGLIIYTTIMMCICPPLK